MLRDELGFHQVSEAEIQPGDIIWCIGGSGSPHVEIYAGNNTVYTAGMAPKNVGPNPIERTHKDTTYGIWRAPGK